MMIFVVVRHVKTTTNGFVLPLKFCPTCILHLIKRKGGLLRVREGVVNLCELDGYS
jgi:hypothetical protein